MLFNRQGRQGRQGRKVDPSMGQDRQPLRQPPKLDNPSASSTLELFRLYLASFASLAVNASVSSIIQSVQTLNRQGRKGRKVDPRMGEITRSPRPNSTILGALSSSCRSRFPLASFASLAVNASVLKLFNLYKTLNRQGRKGRQVKPNGSQ